MSLQQGQESDWYQISHLQHKMLHDNEYVWRKRISAHNPHQSKPYLSKPFTICQGKKKHILHVFELKIYLMSALVK